MAVAGGININKEKEYNIQHALNVCRQLRDESERDGQSRVRNEIFVLDFTQGVCFSVQPYLSLCFDVSFIHQEQKSFPNALLHANYMFLCFSPPSVFGFNVGCSKYDVILYTEKGSTVAQYLHPVHCDP